MAIKKDDTGKRWVEMDVVVPGTPEQVWQAIATGPGYTAWFTPTEIEEREGGAIRFDFGSMGGSAGKVTAWEPPRRFAYVEHDWSEGAPPVATEITVTARSGGRCLIRMVHSLFTTSDDWDDQVEGFEKGWPGFFKVLALYLAHFAGRRAAVAWALASTSDDALTAWKQLTAGLGLAGADVGEARNGMPDGHAGIVEAVGQDHDQRHVILRLSAPAPGLLFAGTCGSGDGGTRASMAVYFYGDDAPRQASEGSAFWQRWFEETFRAA